MRDVGEIVQKAVKNDGHVVVVCSALSGITDHLLELAALAQTGDAAYQRVVHEVATRHERACPVMDWKFVVLSHNTVRGAAGGAILNAELLVKKGLIV